MDGKRSNKRLMEATGVLNAPHSHEETVKIIVSRAAEVSGSDGACLFMVTKEGKLKAEGGFPEKDHIVGVDLTSETGETFFREVLARGVHELVEIADPRVSYLRDLAKIKEITSVLAVPLYHEGEPVGILALDFLREHKIDESVLDEVFFLSHVAAMVLWKEQHRQERKNEENLYLLGRNIMGTVHDLAHLVQHIDMPLILANECLAKGEYDGDPEIEAARGYVGKASSKARDMVRYINSLNTFARPRELKLGRINLNIFLAEFVSDLCSVDNRLGIEQDFDLRCHSVIADKMYLRSVFRNLFENAVQAGATNLAISTQIKDEERKIVVSVSNDGNPMDPEFAKLIFEPFITDKERGTGLGLSNARSIIRSHKGEIRVEVGPPTIFIITLPLSD